MGKRRRIKFIGRCPSTASATGNKKQHEKEFKCFIVSLFGELTEEEKAAIKAEEDAKIAAAKAKEAEKQKLAANKKAEVKAQSAKVEPEAAKKEEKGKPVDQTKPKDPPADQPKNKK